MAVILYDFMIEALFCNVTKIIGRRQNKIRLKACCSSKTD